MPIRSELAAAFHRLHRPQNGGILILPNAWDALSARVIEQAGAQAIATTSAGVSWALGRPDGQGVARDEMIEAVRRIAEAVRVPVTADVESGYGSGSPDAVAETVRDVVEAAAGADGVFVPGVVDASTIARLVKAVDAPVNIMALYGAPSIAELAGLGVARVSVGPAIARAAMATIRSAARELLETGTYDALMGGVSYEEANALFRSRSPRSAPTRR